MEIVGIDNSNPYRKIIIDDTLIKLLHSISSDDSCYVKKHFLRTLCVSSQRYCNCLRISKGRLHYANAAPDGWLS